MAEIHIFVDVGEAVGRVADRMNAVTRLGGLHGTLDAPPVVDALTRMAEETQACGRVVDGALALPEIPDARSEVQFRDSMALRRQWVVSVLNFCRTHDIADVERFEALGYEATKQGALIEDELRRAWPAEGKA